MKKVCFLNGNLILREHKTGVHYHHEKVMKELCCMDIPYEIKIALFDRKGMCSKLTQKRENEWIDKYLVKTKLGRIFCYVLPIELLFGKNDMYICDGLVPHTIYKSKKAFLVHDMMVKIYPQNYKLINRIYLNYFYSQLKKADIIFCQSINSKNDIIKFCHINPDKIIVSYTGADRLEKRKLKEINYTLNVDYNLRFLFYIGDMRINKNLINMVKGFLEFCEKNHVSDLYFYLAGSKNGEYEKLLRICKISKYGNQVKFLGYISDDEKYLLYEKCEAVMFASYYEGFGTPIMEGIQHYKPVITSNCSSMKEIGEGAAILVNPYEYKEIAGAIEEIYYGRYLINKDIYSERIKKYTFKHTAEVMNKEIKLSLGI